MFNYPTVPSFNEVMERQKDFFKASNFSLEEILLENHSFNARTPNNGIVISAITCMDETALNLLYIGT